MKRQNQSEKNLSGYGAVLDELCANVRPCDVSIRTGVACRLLAVAKLGELTIDDLRRAGKVLSRADHFYT
jgi:hypothetical protein